ncbi:MAG: alpha/beta hydrolase [Chitinophagaceae bacterium]|nr:MAG: alpha/beta hydrolase [Chitinophagaceae bacterium]
MRSLRLSFFFLIVLAAQPASAQPWIPLSFAPKQLPFNGGSIHYVESGRGRALIFLHAGFQDVGMWRDQLLHFNRDYRVIALDLPGHGATVDGKRTPAADSVLLALMDGLQIEKAALIGLSFGSAVALEFASKHPERVTKLVMAAPAVAGIEEVQELHPTTLEAFNGMMQLLADKDTAAAAAHFVKSWYIGPNRTQQTVPSKLYEYGLTTTLRNMRNHHASGWAGFSKPLPVQRIASLKVPLLLLVGSNDLPQVAMVSAYIRKVLPDTKEVIFPGAAHMLNVEQPERFNRVVRRFLVGN